MSATFKDRFRHITAGQEVADIVQLTGIDQGSISRYLNGRREPNLRNLRRIARAYQVPADDLLPDLEDAA